MFTYQIRPRTFRVLDGDSLPFPNPAEITVVMSPLQPFGVEAPGGRTITKGTGGTIVFDSNTGKHFVVRKNPLIPIDLKIKESSQLWEIKGNELKVTIDRCESNEELTALIDSIYFVLPILLNTEFSEPPVITRIAGKVGESRFRWELREWHLDYEVTSKESQEQKFHDAWVQFNLLSDPGNRRLAGALHYFHRASRLAVAGESPWEFMAESILNLCKTLEAIFPPVGDITREPVRTGLGDLGYSTEEIERDFMPAMVLRAAVDVGHVNLAVYTWSQLSAVHRYTEVAESAIREMLRRLMKSMAAGTFAIEQYTLESPSAASQKVISKLEEYYGESG